MKRGHVILIAGAALIVAGIAISTVWGISFVRSFLANNTVVANTTLEPGVSLDAKTTVDALDRPLSLAMGVERQQSFSPNEISLSATVTDPEGKVVSSNEFQDSFFTTLQPETTGTHTATVTNIGTKPVTVSGTFGYMPFVGEGRSDVDMMSPGLGIMIVGGGLIAAGIVTLIAGGIITAIDGRGTQSTTTTTEGGITYRKD